MKRDHFLIPLILIVVWQGLSLLRVIPSYKLPSPVEIVLGFKDLLVVGVPPGHLLHNHMLYSLYRVVLGYAVASLLAIPLGLLMGWSAKLLKMIRPLIEVVRPIPPLAWIPIAILWFGIGIKSAAFIIFLGAFFPDSFEYDLGSLIHPSYSDRSGTNSACEGERYLSQSLISRNRPIHLCRNADWDRHWMDDPGGC